MKIFITLDYELYFGPTTGTVERCLLRPTEALLEVFDRRGVKGTFFVDAGFLRALERQKDELPALEKDYTAVVRHLRSLIARGHDVQLHIHPHWENSRHDGARWIIDTGKYKLTDFMENEIGAIVAAYKQTLENVAERKTFAYRAGGWCAQPFDKIAPALKTHNLWVDSTVYPEGMETSPARTYDFRSAPRKTAWRFERDLLREEEGGFFLEIPISSLRVSPLFYFRLAAFKKTGGAQAKGFGDGEPVKMSKTDLWKKMRSFSWSTVSLDGYRASLLGRAAAAYERREDDPSETNFVIIGHPKALSRYSLARLGEFLDARPKTDRFETFRIFGSGS